MVITVLQTLFATFTFAERSHAQSVYDVVITTQGTKVSLEEALHTIQQNSGFVFAYNKNLLKNLKGKTRFTYQNTSVGNILEDLSQQFGVDFKQINATISVKRTVEKVSTPPPPPVVITVTGQVTDVDTGEPMIGVTVVVKENASIGTITDVNGQYSLNVPDNATALIFSSVGYLTREVVLEGRAAIDVSLQQDVQQLGEVVVTALGVEREVKALGYAVQEVAGSDLTEAKETNLVSSLSGKMAGVQVTSSGTTIGGSSRVIIRGESSLNIDENQPLFVVDGLPISNNLTGSDGDDNVDNMPVDYGNAASEINPDDIASISVLKGPAAAALYGSRAANGAIIITTKSGKGGKGLGITVNSNVTFQTPLRLPDYQNKYGQGNNGLFSFVDGAGSGTNDGVDESWGPALNGQLIAQFDSPRDVDGYRGGDVDSAPEESTITPTAWKAHPNNIRNFFETGVTYSNSVALTSSGEFGNVRFSWTNLNQKGMVPNTDLNRNTLALKTGMNLTDKLKVNVTANYINTFSNNRPTIGYGTESLMYLWIWYGRQINTGNLRNYWQKGLEGEQQFNYNYNYHDNPYFNAYENTNGQNKDRILGNVQASYQFTKHLSVQVRTGVDFYNDLRDRRRAFSTQRFANGMYREDRVYFMERNSDFLASYHNTIEDAWTYNLSIGGNRMKQVNKYMSTSAIELLMPDIYNFSNAASDLFVSQNNTEKRINSLYGYGQLTYKNMIFMDVTGRNDWSSTLPDANNSYFYPSVTLSGVLSDMVTLPRPISFAKLRLAVAQVGSDTDPNNLTNVYTAETAWGSNQAKSESDELKNANLKPLSVTSYEVGTDIRFFEGRLDFDFTYYENHSKNQIIPFALDISTGYNSRVVNAGEIMNRGVEVMLHGRPVQALNGITWDISANFTKSTSKVIKLIDGLESYTLAEQNNAYIQARVGQRMGNIYGLGFERVTDKNSEYYGQIVNDDSGLPQTGTSLQYQGNYNPDWMLGIQNAVAYKNFSLNFLFDIRQGGTVVSYTKTIGSTSGQLKETLEGRATGYDITEEGNGILSKGVVENSDGTYSENTTKVSARDYNYSYYDRSNIEASKYDASYVKLREVRLGYTLPASWFKRAPFRSVKVSAVGRNLALWTENPHFDPDVMAMSGGTLVPGVENMAYPTPRSYGFNLNIQL